MTTDLFETAAHEAIRRWKGLEGQLAMEVRDRDRIDEDFLRRWLGAWMLARSNPRPLRVALAASLHDARRRVQEAANGELGNLIGRLAKEMFDQDVTKGRQTSLVSKFAFSLRPEEIAIYDKHGRYALAEEVGQRIKEHDYVAYLKAFYRFAQTCGRILDETALTERLRPRWQPVMTERLFKLRTADKLLMLRGGFPIHLMQ